MPTSGNRGNVARRSVFRIRGKSARSVDADHLRRSPSRDCGDLLHIGPALGAQRRGLGPRAHSTLGGNISRTNAGAEKEGRALDRERCDRVSLDRRGLTTLPDSLCTLQAGAGPRLLSLQHNLLTSLQGLSAPCLSSLVLLDLYDNQVQDICSLETLQSLRVLLMGKNRIRKIEGLSGVAAKLEVLDLHGNRITQASELGGLRELKVLNLAGNQLRSADLRGLPQLRELNLKRNRLRRVTGCEGAPKLQKLFLSNNDLQSIDDISSVAMAASLREVTLDGNPVALGGDCVTFLVSYLPTLAFISQMQVTDEVRRAAMAWRHNKEVSANIALSELGQEADANARREQVISNARTNWELLRSQSKSNSSPTASITNTTNTSVEFLLDSGGLLKSETPDIIKTTNFVQFSKTSSNIVKNAINSTNNGFGEKRVNFSHRSVSQDTDISHSTSTSSELLKLPPILVPIIDSLEHQRLTLGGLDASEKPAVKVLKRWESLSSVDPVINSSLSSLPTTTSESDSEVSKKNPQRRVPTANKKRATFAGSKSVSVSDNQARLPMKNRSISDNSENMSVLSTATNLNSTLTNSSNSGSEMNNRVGRKEVLSRAGSAKSRYIKSATTLRRTIPKQTTNRPVTAKPKPVSKTTTAESSTPVNQDPVVKDREQGGDWLVEVRCNEGSVWGLGALKRLEKGWPQADGVTTLHFHYVSFADISARLPIIKTRFPNAVHLTFRACGISVAGQLGALAALRGLSSLVINKEGNPLTAKPWQRYALYRLAHWGLRTLDHQEVTDSDISAANEEYAGLSDVVLWSLPDSLLQPLLSRLQGERDGNTPKQVLDNTERDISNQRNRDASIQRRVLERDNSVQRRRAYDRDGSNTRRVSEKVEEPPPAGVARNWLWGADPALRDVVAREALQWRRSVMSQEEVVHRHRGRAHLSRVLCQAANAAIKLRLLRRQWPAILLLLLTQILEDYSRMPDHVAKHMRELNSQLLTEGASKK